MFLFFKSLEEVNKGLIKLAKEKSLNIIIQNDICQIKIKNQTNDEDIIIEAGGAQIEGDELTERVVVPFVLELKNKIINLENGSYGLKNKMKEMEIKINI